MKLKLATFFGSLALVVIVTIVNLTSPTSIGPSGVLVFFVSTYVFFMCFFYVFLTVGVRLFAGMIELSGKHKATVDRLLKDKLYYYSTVVALAPTIYIGMQSVGGADVFEVGLLLLFEALACFFIHKKY